MLCTSLTVDSVLGQLWSPSAFLGSMDKVSPLTTKPRHSILGTSNLHLVGRRK